MSAHKNNQAEIPSALEEVLTAAVREHDRQVVPTALDDETELQWTDEEVQL